MKTYRTTRDVLVAYPEFAPGRPIITIPAGTELVQVMNPGGASYAVKSKALLIDLTGNSHDPQYRFCYVPADSVETI